MKWDRTTGQILDIISDRQDASPNDHPNDCGVYLCMKDLFDIDRLVRIAKTGMFLLGATIGFAVAAILGVLI